MGISCSILSKKGSYNDALELYKEMEIVCLNNKYYCEIFHREKNVEGKTKAIYFSVSDRPFESSVSRQLAIFLFDEPYEYKDISFDWYSEEVFFEAMYIDFFNGNEDLLLELLYGFMKTYNDTIIWIEQDWFYFYEDFVNIKQKPFDSSWCYKNPHQDN